MWFHIALYAQIVVICPGLFLNQLVSKCHGLPFCAEVFGGAKNRESVGRFKDKDTGQDNDVGSPKKWFYQDKHKGHQQNVLADRISGMEGKDRNVLISNTTFQSSNSIKYPGVQRPIKQNNELDDELSELLSTLFAKLIGKQSYHRRTGGSARNINSNKDVTISPPSLVTHEQNLSESSTSQLWTDQTINGNVEGFPTNRRSSFQTETAASGYSLRGQASQRATLRGGSEMTPTQRRTTLQRGSGMMSQMALGLGVLTDRNMMYGPGIMSSGSGSGRLSSGPSMVGMSTMGAGINPFQSNGMSANAAMSGMQHTGSHTPTGLASGGMSGTPQGLSNSASAMSPFSRVKEGNTAGGMPFNLGKFAMKGPNGVGPPIGGMNMNSGMSRDPEIGRQQNNGGSTGRNNLENKVVYGDTASVQYINGKIVLPRNWSIADLNRMTNRLKTEHAHKKEGCGGLQQKCPDKCLEFDQTGCPVCKCKENTCPAFAAGCPRGRVKINQDGCPVCDTNSKDENWYDRIWSK